MRASFTDTYKLSALPGARHRALADSRVRKHDAAPYIDAECRKVCEGTGNAVLEGNAPATQGSKDNGGQAPARRGVSGQRQKLQQTPTARRQFYSYNA